MSDDEANRIARKAQRLNLSRGAKIALPTAAALGAGAAIAIGSIPSSNDHVFTACYDNRTDLSTFGTLRLIDPTLSQPGGPTAAFQCGQFESMVTWNQQGPAGPVGPQGPAGQQGTVGAQGVQGVQGAPLLGGTTFGISGNSSKIFLKIDGITGAATDKVHKGDITVQSFSFGSLAAPSTLAAGGGGGAGKVKFAEFSITKVLDKSSPVLFQSAAQGKHYAKVELMMRKAGKDQMDFLKFDFQNVIISSYKIITTGGGNEVPTESISFNFTKVIETFLKANKALGSLTITPNTYTITR
jgi:type VI secretion system secreted protein Hcp